MMGSELLGRVRAQIQQRLLPGAKGAALSDDLFEFLLRKHMDADASNTIHTDEYYSFYITCNAWDQKAASMVECLESLARHFDPRMVLRAEQEQLEALRALLRPLSYTTEINKLLTRFLPGSRAWVFDEFDSWRRSPVVAGTCMRDGRWRRQRFRCVPWCCCCCTVLACRDDWCTSRSMCCPTYTELV